jgi:ABC-type nitrate/sulfonate/bicarbonate transport system permease component
MILHLNFFIATLSLILGITLEINQYLQYTFAIIPILILIFSIQNKKIKHLNIILISILFFTIGSLRFHQKENAFNT